MRRILDAFKVNKQKWISEVSLWLRVIIFPWDCPSCLVNLMFFHVIGSIEKLRNVKLERCWCSWHTKCCNSEAKPSSDSKSAHVITNSFLLDVQAITWFCRSASSAVFCAQRLTYVWAQMPHYCFKIFFFWAILSKSFFPLYTLATSIV